MASIEVIQGATTQYFHVLPSDIERKTLTPQKETIYQYLSRLSSGDFVDFVIDLLVQVKGHTFLERSDGPGDEKQDILTIDANGQRHLTQCKHTINYAKNSSGDELDLLFGACHRKACRNALFVTNTDLTVQAKRYVSDREYLRLPTANEDVITVDYWNAYRIWEQVSKSTTILNKWFSGMAQCHALRQFDVDIVITRMPSGEHSTLDATSLAKSFERQYKVEGLKDRAFRVSVDDSLTLTVSDWFRGSAELGVPFHRRNDGVALANIPLRTIKVSASLRENVGSYNINELRDRLGTLVATELFELTGAEWWHLLVTAPQAFIFLHDIAKPIHVDLGDPQILVRMGSRTACPEREWAALPSKSFVRASTEEDPDDVAWVHRETDSTLRIFIDEVLDSARAWDIQFRNDQIVEHLRSQSFRGVENADALVVDMVRRLSRPEWFVLQSTQGDLFWSYPQDADAAAIETLEKILAARNVRVLHITDEDRAVILSNIQSSRTNVSGMIVSAENAFLTPLELSHRTFWFQSRRSLNARLTADNLQYLIEFKLDFEAGYGHEEFSGKSEVELASSEIRRFLFDPMSVRGRRMLDVGYAKREIQINLRIRENAIDSATELSDRYVAEFALLCDQLLRRAFTGSRQV